MSVAFAAHLSRRMSRIALGVVLVAAAFLFASAPRASAWTTTDFTNLKAQYFDWLTGGTSFNTRDSALQGKLRTINDRAETWWRSMDTTDPRDSLWADQMWPQSGGLFIQVSYDRLREMALAYKTPCSSGMGYTCLYRNTTMRDDIIGGLDWLYSEWFHPGVARPRNANWYIYEIGSPDYLIQSMILLEEELTSRQKTDWLEAIREFIEVTYEGGYASGANRAWGARVFLGVGALLGGSAGNDYVTLARDGMSVFGTKPSMFAYRTRNGDKGFYEDGSYMDHSWYGYNGGYGGAYYDTVASIVHLLNGSIWEVTDSDKSNLVQFGLNAFGPMIYRGAILPSTMGRGNTGGPEWTDHHAGHAPFAPMLLAIDLANRTDALKLKQLLKLWITTDRFLDYYSDQYTSMFSVLRAQAIINDSGVTATDQAVERQFRQMDRAAIQRPRVDSTHPGYMFGVAMTSRDRTESYESILGQNTRGWHTGDGATYLYPGNEITPYEDYWETVNSNRLAGTTVENGTQPARYSSNNTWTGGASTGTYGAAGMYLQRPSGTMEAKKSWFMFDDEIVAMGSGITGTGSATVETIIDNRKLADGLNNHFLMNGIAQETSAPWGTTMAGTSWMWLEGNAANSGIGYYLPNAVTVKAKREARTGCLNEVNADFPTCPPASTTTKTYLTTWFEHGVRPSNVKYTYAILPTMTDTETAAYARSPDISILKRDTDVHAVLDRTMDYGMTMANYWNDTTATFDIGTHTPWFGSDRKASVITHQTYDGINDYLDVWVADPTHLNTGNITLTFYGRTLRTVAADPEVTISQTSPTTIARVNVNGANGKTIHYRIAFAY